MAAEGSSDAKTVLEGLEMDTERYIALMTKLIGESKFVQNSPPDHNPEEDKASNHVLELLAPYTTENGGPLTVRRIHYAEKRGNVIITYPGTEEGKTVGFVGCHLDVVPANPETWDHDPFTLTVDGDKLLGRGTTDCLGHVGCVTELMLLLAKTKPVLTTTVAAVFIASEEAASVEGVGVEGLVEAGELDFLKGGPIFWVDSSDSEPCIGTAGAISWVLRTEGKLFHSGLPHRGINSLELGMEALNIVQKRFYEDFPPCKEEEDYAFATPSTMKPTQWSCHKNAVNQICPWSEISGDIRVTPFHKNADVKAAVEKYVAEINAGIDELPVRGTASKYRLPAGEESKEELVGKVTITWGDHEMSGVACSLTSPGFAALRDSIKEVRGSATPFAITGSLPCVAELKEAGFDLQITGFGKSTVYHADNEYCLLSDMQAAVKVLARIIAKLQ